MTLKVIVIILYDPFFLPTRVIELKPPTCSQLAEKVDLPQGGPKIMSKLEPPPLRGNLMNTLNSVAEYSKTKDNSTSALAV